MEEPHTPIVRRQPAERARRTVVVAGGCCTTCCCCCCCVHSIIGLAGSVAATNSVVNNAFDAIEADAFQRAANAYWASVGLLIGLVILVIGKGSVTMGGFAAFMSLPVLQVIAVVPAYFFASRDAEASHVAYALRRIATVPAVVSAVLVAGAMLIGAC